jgi:hypothetical protein
MPVSLLTLCREMTVSEVKSFRSPRLKEGVKTADMSGVPELMHLFDRVDGVPFAWRRGHEITRFCDNFVTVHWVFPCPTHGRTWSLMISIRGRRCSSSTSGIASVLTARQKGTIAPPRTQPALSSRTRRVTRYPPRRVARFPSFISHPLLLSVTRDSVRELRGLTRSPNVPPRSLPPRFQSCSRALETCS